MGCARGWPTSDLAATSQRSARRAPGTVGGREDRRAALPAPLALHAAGALTPFGGQPRPLVAARRQRTVRRRRLLAATSRDRERRRAQPRPAPPRARRPA